MKGLEMGFLDNWSSWDEVDTFFLQFYNPVYKRGVGIPDEIIDEAGLDSVFSVDGEHSTISIYTDSGEIFLSKVKLVTA